MESKLQELTRKLYDEGLEQGRAEAERMKESAKSESERIIRQAEQQAARIITDATNKAEEIKKNGQTELELASRQAVAQLKEQIEKMIALKCVDSTVAKIALDEEFVKQMLLTVAANWNGSEGNSISLSALLPADKQAEFEQQFKSSASALASKGIEIGYSAKVKSGFSIGPKNGGYYISFSKESFNALLGEFLKERSAKILYNE